MRNAVLFLAGLSLVAACRPAAPEREAPPPAAAQVEAETPDGLLALAVTRDGDGLRFTLKNVSDQTLRIMDPADIPCPIPVYFRFEDADGQSIPTDPARGGGYLSPAMDCTADPWPEGLRGVVKPLPPGGEIAHRWDSSGIAMWTGPGLILEPLMDRQAFASRHHMVVYRLDGDDRIRSLKVDAPEVCRWRRTGVELAVDCDE